MATDSSFFIPLNYTAMANFIMAIAIQIQIAQMAVLENIQVMLCVFYLTSKPM